MLRHSFRALSGVGLAAALLVAGFGIVRAANHANGQSDVGVSAYYYPANHYDTCEKRCSEL